MCFLIYLKMGDFNRESFYLHFYLLIIVRMVRLNIDSKNIKDILTL